MANLRSILRLDHRPPAESSAQFLEMDRVTARLATRMYALGWAINQQLAAVGSRNCMAAGQLGEAVAPHIGLAGIHATSVAAAAVNRRALRAYDDGRRDWIPVPAGDTVIAIGSRQYQAIRSTRRNEVWPGHLLLVHEPSRIFVDATSGQFARPLRSIAMPSVVVGILPEDFAESHNLAMYEPAGSTNAAVGYTITPLNRGGFAGFDEMGPFRIRMAAHIITSVNTAPEEVTAPAVLRPVRTIAGGTLLELAAANIAELDERIERESNGSQPTSIADIHSHPESLHARGEVDQLERLVEEAGGALAKLTAAGVPPDQPEASADTLNELSRLGNEKWQRGPAPGRFGPTP